MSSQVICTYYINGEQYDVIACFDTDTPKNYFDFYDLYNTSGECLNEGIPFYKLPSYREVIEFLQYDKELKEIL